jgi:heme oxygenase
LPQVEHAVAYLAAYDGRVSDHWLNFGALLDAVGATEESAAEVIAATHEGFEAARTWFKPRNEVRRFEAS